MILSGVTYATDTGYGENLNQNLSSSISYQMGNPVLTDIWVDPVNGNDQNTGNNTSKALKTFSEAWDRIPTSQVLSTTGYRIMLMPGNYNENNLPSNGWMESRYGSYSCPIIIQSAYGVVNLQTSDILNFYNCRYLYLIGLNLQSNANNVLHLEKCDHILLKNLNITGLGTISDYSSPQEDLKVNQCQFIYLENCDISNAWNVPVDFVAVDSGHIIGNIIHQAGDWCIYLKGGSSHFIISNNEIYDAENGGFTAGQGTDFQWMMPPYLHYEVYDIKFINNIIHDTHGAGMGVNGGYNILLAYNTLYRVGSRSHVLEFTHGTRNCGDVSKCQNYLSLGGWGTAIIGDEQKIPNKNVYVYNNIIYNPDGYQSQWSQLAVDAQVTPRSGTNIPSPSLADDNLQIKGNIIWNGASDLPLGLENIETSLNSNQLRQENEINTIKPQLVDPEKGNFRPVNNGNDYNATTYPIPDFTGNDIPRRPLVPSGNLNNTVDTDYELNFRDDSSPPGAFAISNTSNQPPTVSASPGGGSFNSIQTITLWMNHPGTIYYTLNGTDPTTTSAKYTVPITINTTTTLKFRAIDNKGTKSIIYTEIYTINNPPLTVNSTSPSNGASAVSISSLITLNFSNNIISGTNYDSIYIKNLKSGSTLSITKNINGKTLTIYHTNPLKNNTTYKVYIPAGALQDVFNNSLKAAYTFSFSTVTGTTDTTPPSIKSTSPSNGATGVSITNSLIIYFNENIIAGANYSGIYIKNMTSGSKVSIASKTISSNILTIKQTNSRKNKTLYQIYIPAGAVKDLAGNILQTAFTYQFKTV